MKTIKRILKHFLKPIKKYVYKWATEIVDKKMSICKDIQIKNSENIVNQKLMYKLISEHFSGVQFIGQELQDMYAYLWFKGRKDGFFVDIGAYDGIAISNTYAFEKLGWKGVCIEPVPSIYGLLVKNRKCDCINAAISNVNNEENKFIQTRGGRSGFVRNMSPAVYQAAEEEGIVAEINVRSITFDSAISKYTERTIDFMSIDVEGTEMEVLETINFEKYKFGLITIENNCGEHILRSFMKLKGYKVLFNIGVDIMFIPEDIDVGQYWWKEPI